MNLPSSNYRSDKSFENWLKKIKACITGIDTDCSQKLFEMKERNGFNSFSRNKLEKLII